MRRWREEMGGPALRTILGRRLAKVTFTGSRWRAMVWKKQGASTWTAPSLVEAMDWCEIALDQDAPPATHSLPTAALGALVLVVIPLVGWVMS